MSERKIWFKPFNLEIMEMEKSPCAVGQQYLVRTVTMIVAGKLEAVHEQELVFSSATWIADTGRFSDCLKDPTVVREAEPFVQPAIVGRGAIVDATIWPHERLQQK